MCDATWVVILLEMAKAIGTRFFKGAKRSASMSATNTWSCCSAPIGAPWRSNERTALCTLVRDSKVGREELERRGDQIPLP